MKIYTQSSDVESRAPIPWEANVGNWFQYMFSSSLLDPNIYKENGPEIFSKFLKSLADSPRNILMGSTFFGEIPFNYGRGPVADNGGRFGGIQYISSNPDEIPPNSSDLIYGRWNDPTANLCTGWDLLPADVLAERIEKIKLYTKALHEFGKVKRIMPYIDFSSGLYGRHNSPTYIDNPCTCLEGFPDWIITDPADPQYDPNDPLNKLHEHYVCTDCPAPITDPNDPNNSPPKSYGFWEFYERWDEYARPNGLFELGTKPPPPTEWLRTWSPTASYNQDLGVGLSAAEKNDLKQFSFGYTGSVRACERQGPNLRYAVCINHQGWELWWRQVVRWIAIVGYDGVFVDNSTFQDCWNSECEAGYQVWLEENFTGQEIERYFTKNLPLSILLEATAGEGWYIDPNNNWAGKYWSYSGSNGGIQNPISPDSDALQSLYCYKVTGPGDIANTQSCLSQPVGILPLDYFNTRLKFLFYYRITGSVEINLLIEWQINGQVVSSHIFPISSLANEMEWVPSNPIKFNSPMNAASLYIAFQVSGAGTVWFDGMWLGKESDSLERQIRTLDNSNANNIVHWASLAYWLFTSDQKLGYLRDEGRKINPDFEVFSNGFHSVNVDYFETEGKVFDLEAHREDVGKFPGMYDPHGTPLTFTDRTDCQDNNISINAPLLVSNIFGYKYIHSSRRPGSFGYHMPQLFAYIDDLHDQGTYLLNEDTALLNMAEMAAFGGGTGIDNRLRAYYNIYGYTPYEISPLALNIRDVEDRFWNDVKDYNYLFAGYHTHADIAIVFHDFTTTEPCNAFDHLMSFVKGLAGKGVLWDVLSENRCTLENFKRYKCIIYQDIERISEAELNAVKDYLDPAIGNGIVIAANIVGNFDEWFRPRYLGVGTENILEDTWPPININPFESINPPHSSDDPRIPQPSFTNGNLVYQDHSLNPDAVIDILNSDFNLQLQIATLPNQGSVAGLRFNTWIKYESDTTIALHILNYNVSMGIANGGKVTSIDNKLIISLLLPVQNVQSVINVKSITLYEPGINKPPLTLNQNAFTLDPSSRLIFTIPSLIVYTIALIEYTE